MMAQLQKLCLLLLLSFPLFSSAQTLSPDNWLEGIKKSKSGDTLRLGPGIFETSELIRLQKSIAIIGAGSNRTAIKSSARAGLVLKQGGIFLKDLSISGDKFGIDLQTPVTGPCRFEQVRFCESENGAGVAGTNVYFEKCVFEDNRVLGTYVYGGKLKKEPRALMNIVFDQCEWRNNAIGPDANVVHHAGAIKIIPNCAGIQILDCQIVDAKGIWIDGCHGGHIIRNNYVETTDNALHFEVSGHQDQRRTIISDNVFISKNKHGAYISCSSNVDLTHNTIAGPRGISMAGVPRSNNYVSGTEFESMRNNLISRNVVFTDLKRINVQSEEDAQNKAQEKGYAVPERLIYDNQVQHNIIKPLEEYGQVSIPAEYGPRP